MEDQPIQLLDNSQAQFSSNASGAACIRVPHSVIVRAPGLLPMWYTPHELAEELRISARIIREWLSRGLSHRRDECGHILVDGRRMAAWVKTIGQSQPRHPLEDDEAYCLSCRQPVKLTNPTHTQRGKQVLWRGVCPICGSAICRGGRHG